MSYRCLKSAGECDTFPLKTKLNLNGIKNGITIAVHALIWRKEFPVNITSKIGKQEEMATVTHLTSFTVYMIQRRKDNCKIS